MRAIAQVLKPDGQVWPVTGPNWSKDHFLKRAIARAATASERVTWNHHAKYVGLPVEECMRRAKARLEKGQYAFGRWEECFAADHHKEEVAALDTGTASYCACRGCIWRGWITHFEPGMYDRGGKRQEYSPQPDCPVCRARVDIIRQQADFEEAAQ